MAGTQLELMVCEEERHYWSPALTVSLDGGPNSTKLRGRYGPHASVWTMFMSIHLLWVFTATAATMYAIGAWTLGHKPWSLVLLPLAALLNLLTYAVMRVGQRLGQDQIHLLHHAFDVMLEDDLAYLDPAPSADRP
jgi:hypothetical protein